MRLFSLPWSLSRSWLAQEVRKVVPEAVIEDEKTGILSVNYSELVPVLITAFNELVVKNSSFEAETRDAIQNLYSITSSLGTAFVCSITLNDPLADHNRLAHGDGDASDTASTSSGKKEDSDSNFLKNEVSRLSAALATLRKQVESDPFYLPSSSKKQKKPLHLSSSRLRWIIGGSAFVVLLILASFVLFPSLPFTHPHISLFSLYCRFLTS